MENHTNLRVVHVLQQPNFFQSTMLENLRYGVRPGSDDGNIERVRRLILQNADLDHRVNFSTPLSEAARGGHLAVVRLLLVGGANKDAVNVHTRPYAPATLLHPPLC